MEQSQSDASFESTQYMEVGSISQPSADTTPIIRPKQNRRRFTIDDEDSILSRSNSTPSPFALSQQSRLPPSSSQLQLMIPISDEERFRQRKANNATFEYNPPMVECNETIDLKKLACIIIQLEAGDFQEIKDFKFNRNQVDRASYIKYLKQYMYEFEPIVEGSNIIGRKKMIYSQKPLLQEGRMWCKSKLSLQNMTKKIRHIIQDPILVDIDIQACHPTILSQICKNYGIEFPALDEYINNKSTITLDIMKANNMVYTYDENDVKGKEDYEINKNNIKDQILATINGGSFFKVFPKATKWWTEYFNQAQTALKEIVNIN